MKQRWLPGFDGPDVEQPPAAMIDPDPVEEAEAPGIPVLPGQRQLFTVERDLLGQIEAALAAGRFEDARRHRDALVATEGPSAEARALALLDEIGDLRFWERPVADVLDDWVRLDSRFLVPSHLRRLIRDAGLGRLLDRPAPRDLQRAAPAVLAPLCNLLGRDGPGPAAFDADGAVLLRDGLLDGVRPEPGDLEDRRFADLLAEDDTPVWLACLGALRHLWPVPPTDARSLAHPLPPLAEGDAARGRQFWACLQRTVVCRREDNPAVEARVRMKQLRPDFHALFMRSGVRRE